MTVSEEKSRSVSGFREIAANIRTSVYSYKHDPMKAPQVDRRKPDEAEKEVMLLHHH